jgi:hypothetical protein
VIRTSSFVVSPFSAGAVNTRGRCGSCVLRASRTCSGAGGRGWRGKSSRPPAPRRSCAFSPGTPSDSCAREDQDSQTSRAARPATPRRGQLGGLPDRRGPRRACRVH